MKRNKFVTILIILIGTFGAGIFYRWMQVIVRPDVKDYLRNAVNAQTLPEAVANVSIARSHASNDEERRLVKRISDLLNNIHNMDMEISHSRPRLDSSTASQTNAYPQKIQQEKQQNLKDWNDVRTRLGLKPVPDLPF